MLRIVFESLALCGVGLGLVLLVVILLSLVLRLLGFERVPIIGRIFWIMWGGIAALVILAALAGCGGTIPDRQAATSSGMVPTFFASCSQVITRTDVCDDLHGWRHVEWTGCESIPNLFSDLADIPNTAVYSPAPELGADCDHPAYTLDEESRWFTLCHDDDMNDYCDLPDPATLYPTDDDPDSGPEDHAE